MIDCTGASEVRYYYHYDGCGNVIALSNTAGQIVEAYSYDHFGSPTVMTGPGTDGDWATYGDNPTASPVASQLDNPWMFTGRQYDPETGLYYYRARYYHPALGRFMQADPLGYIGGLNLYAYCGNNATNLRDPAGLYAWNSSFGFGNNLAANVLEAVGDLGALCGSDLATAYSEGIGDGCAILADAITLRLFPSWHATANAKRCEYGSVGDLTWGSSQVASASLWTLAGLRALGLDMTLTDTTIYRVCGGDSLVNGYYWTPYDPRTVADLRNVAGLPGTNWGTNLVVGTVPPGTILTSVGPATPIVQYGVTGGLLQYGISNSIIVVNQNGVFLVSF